MSGGPIMIMAGGTGGHVFPGLAVAEALRARHGSVVWLGTQRGLEARVVPLQGIDVEWISITGVRGRGVAAWLGAPFRIIGAVLQTFAALRRRRPAAVFGMGGFVAGPGGVAAWLARKPLVLHEPNAVAGTTNRLLAPLAARIFTSFPNTVPPSERVEVIGTPVRSSFAATDAPRERLGARRAQRRRLLIVGGSQGARVLNRTVPAALALLPEQDRPDVWHQAGRLTVDEARAAYAAAGVSARIDTFIEDMPSAYRWADLVVARAGAGTVAEAAAAGVPVLLVPLADAAGDHQAANAAAVVAAGAGVMVRESAWRGDALAGQLAAWLGQPAQWSVVAEAARRQATPDAAARIVADCEALMAGRW